MFGQNFMFGSHENKSKPLAIHSKYMIDMFPKLCKYPGYHQSFEVVINLLPHACTHKSY